MILEIRAYEGKSIVFSKDIKEVPVPFKREVREYILHLKETCLYYTGIGLAAPQVGRKEQIAVIHGAKLGMKEWITIINPRMALQAEDYASNEAIERCLSYPGLSVNIKRPTSLFMTAYNEYGHHTMFSLEGVPARVFFHEICHLEGVCITDYIGLCETKEEWLKREGNDKFLGMFAHKFEKKPLA